MQQLGQFASDLPINILINILDTKLFLPAHYTSEMDSQLMTLHASILVCEECGDFNFGDCPVHGPLLPVDDTKPSEVGEGISKARSTLPPVLEILESTIEGAGLGVFATEPIEIGIRFGPYQGKKVHRSAIKDENNSGYMWEVGF